MRFMVIHPTMGILGVSLNPNGLMTIPQHTVDGRSNPNHHLATVSHAILAWLMSIGPDVLSGSAGSAGSLAERVTIAAAVLSRRCDDARVRFETLAGRAEQAPTAMQVNEFVSPHSVVSGSAFGEQFLSPVGEAGARSSSNLFIPGGEKPQRQRQVQSFCMSICKLENEPILRDFLNS